MLSSAQLRMNVFLDVPCSELTYLMFFSVMVWCFPGNHNCCTLKEIMKMGIRYAPVELWWLLQVFP